MPARSPAQAEASRRNGARSRGPVSAEGKEAASRNALRHGLCARRIPLPNLDDNAGFQALQAALLDAYRPADGQEHELVMAIVLASWQVRRAQALELQYWTWAHEEASSQPVVWLIAQVRQDLDDRDRSLDTVLRYQVRAEAARARAMRELRLYRADRLRWAEEDGEPRRADIGTNEPEPAAAEPEPVAANTNEPEPAPTTPAPASRAAGLARADAAASSERPSEALDIPCRHQVEASGGRVAPAGTEAERAGPEIARAR